MLSRIFVLLFLVLSFGSTCLHAQTAGYSVGQKISDFTLLNIDGKKQSLSDYKDEKGVIIVFTCNHCPFSVAYEDRIIALHKKYAPLGYPVVAINPNDAVAYPIDSYENMKERASDKSFPFAYLHDESQQVAKTFGAAKTPHVFIASSKKDGFKIDYIGAIDDNSYEPESVQHKYAENALNELIQGKPVSNASTKAVGCSIKWKK